MNAKRGNFTVPSDAAPWPHEIRVAKILSRNGHEVVFIPESNVKTPDIYLDGIEFEIKSPTSKKIDAVERNLSRALTKCPNIIFDGTRMKIRDKQIVDELIRRRRIGKGLKRILFIDKHEKIVDIQELM